MQLLFLDIILTQEDNIGSVSTMQCVLQDCTDQYLNFQSHHPMVHKSAIVRTLLHRAEALSSSGMSRVEEKGASLKPSKEVDTQ